ncbi:MAG: glycosyl hydrolase family 32, partial [Planctomycetes bacterium]|nr:glycosyl hydrolase family 32 [Planctomycetota bacterium]
NHLFVNVDDPEGELRVEVLDGDGQPITPFTRDDCLPIKADSTCMPVAWRGSDDLSSLAGQPIRFRFHLSDGRLYAFWVSPDASGASYGYVAAGGPGFVAPIDTIGNADRH